MEQASIPYERQIFVCTHNANGEKVSCEDHHGSEVFRCLREDAKAKGLHPKIRVAQAKCLGQCHRGVNIMIYPENIWLSQVQVSDIAQIAAQYI